jgi:citrate lyase subunit beta/citryl-CoA lyase
VRIRSLLFAPGNQSRKAEKAFNLAADVVCIDLEDAVAAAEKDAARTATVLMLQTVRSRPFFVRINPLDSAHCFADLEAVVQPGLAGLVLPMVEGATGLLTIDWVLCQLERRRGMTEGSVEILPVIETARGIVRLEDICEAKSRARRLSFGSWDYTLDTGITYTPEDEDSIADARQRVVLHSRSAGLGAPIDTSFPVIGDIQGLQRACARARKMGFGGKACLHPDQIATVNDAFSVSPTDLEQAQSVVAAFEAAEASGSASIKVAGQFVDYPIYKKAKALVQLAAGSAAL